MSQSTPTPVTDWPEHIVRAEMQAHAKEAARDIADAVNAVNASAAIFGLKVRMPDRIIVEHGGKQNTFWLRDDGRPL